MKSYLMPLALLGVFMGLTASISFGSATNVYVAQNSAGSGNGADCADAYGVNYFNTSGDWGTGTGEIGPGTTVHLCGTFTGTPGSTMLTVLGSGASGAPITILFESGADMTSPYWGTRGAINLNGQQYIVLDGGSNGVIQNTANGTALAYQQESNGVYCSGCSNDEVRNLTIRNIYVRTANSSDTSIPTSMGTSCAVAMGYSGSNISVHNVTANDARSLIEFWNASGSTVSNWKIYDNQLSESSWTIDVGGNGGQISNVYIYGNDVDGDDHWWSPSNTYHCDPIFVRAPSGNIGSVYIYDNFVHGPIAHATGGISIGPNTNAPIFVFNNIVSADSTSSDSYHCMGMGDVDAQPAPISTTVYVYNNVFDHSKVCQGVTAMWEYANTLDFRNNIMIDAGGLQTNSTSFTSDDNVWYGIGSYTFKINGTTYSYSQWRGAGYDASSTTNSPALDSTFHPQSGSSAIGLGANLTSTGINELDLDKAGNARPSTGSWDAGAYNFSSTTSGPAAPTGLTGVAH